MKLTKQQDSSNPALQQEVERLLQVFGTTRHYIMNNTNDVVRLFNHILPESGCIFSYPEPQYKWKSGMNTARKLGIIEKYKGSTWRVTSRVEDFFSLRMMLKNNSKICEHNFVRAKHTKQRQLVRALDVAEGWLDWLDDMNTEGCCFSARVDPQILAIAEKNARRHFICPGKLVDPI